MSYSEKLARELTTKTRKALSTEEFVFPEERRYPIHDESHARSALSMVSRHGTPAEKARVRAAVRRRYPHIGQDDKPKVAKRFAGTK